MRKAIIAVLALFLAIAFNGPVFAGPADEVGTFGFTDLRHRVGNVAGGAMAGLMYHFGGPSYSQPLILDGDRWGGDLAGRTVAVTVENNVMYGYLLPDPAIPPPVEEIELQPLWSVKLSGSIPTKSHPTFYEKDGRKYIFIGTYSRHLDIIDVTDFQNVKMQSRKSPHATDITSAPLVLNWRGHDIVVTTSGDTGKIFIVTDPLSNKINGFYINAGPGRTSSSPAPVDGGRAFAVGLDQGRHSGELRIYYLDDILKEGPGGKVEGTGKPARIVEKLNGGLAASFSVDGDMLYFGDTRSNIYAYNVKTKQKSINSDHAGTFSNRSPALTNNLVIFPAVGENKGKLVAVNRYTGRTEWVREFSSRAQTAPSVLTYPGGSEVWAGTSGGWLAFLDTNTGKPLDEPAKIALKFGLSTYASGVSGEISAAGDYVLISTEQGVVGTFLIDPPNLQAVSIYTGIPEGEDARQGQTYRGMAKFKYASGHYPWLPVPVGVFHGDKYLKLTDENGNELPKATLSDGSTVYVLPRMNLGEEYTVYFEWTAAKDDTLTAVIDLPYPPVVDVYQETSENDNKVSESIKVQAYDIKVKIYPYENPWTVVGSPTTVKTTVKVKRKDNIPGNITTRLTINGPAGPKSVNISLSPGEYKRVPYNFTVSSNGNYPMSAEAWPSGVGDIYPADNTDREVIKVLINKAPEPTDKKLHVEIIDGGPIW